MPYSHATLADFKAQLLNRLDDYGSVFFTDTDPVYPEITLYAQEAMRTWQALTGYWRDRATFPTAAGVAFYQLPSLLVPPLLAPTLKDRDIIASIIYHLLEAPGAPSGATPVSVSAWTGSDAFTLDDLTRAIERRRNQFLVETGMFITRTVQATAPPPVTRFPVPDTVIDVRRVAWISIGGTYTHVWRTDEWAAGAYSVNWNINPRPVPSAYSVAVEPPLTVQFIPPVSDLGTVELLTVRSGATLDPVTGVLLGIPDDFAWVVKWGALADLLGRDGQAPDALRSSYCEQRWRQGIAVARLASSAVTAYIDGLPIFLTSLHNLDAYRVGWQNVQGTPDTAALAGWNLLALSKVPDAGPHSVMVDVVRNAPVPLVATDYLQLGREELDVLLDYAQHLATFKEGGAEFTATVPLYERMMRLAMVKNERLKANIAFLESFAGQAVREERERPRRQKAPELQAVEEA